MQPTTTVLDATSAVSIGFLLAVVGGVIRITVLLTQMRAEQAAERERHKNTPEKLESIGRDVSSTKGRVAALEDDVNNLWAFAMTDNPGELFGRLRRGPRSKLSNEGDENSGGHG